MSGAPPRPLAKAICTTRLQRNPSLYTLVDNVERGDGRPSLRKRNRRGLLLTSQASLKARETFLKQPSAIFRNRWPNSRWSEGRVVGPTS